MQLHELLHQRETDPSALMAAGEAAIPLDEWLEESRQDIWRNPDSTIANRQLEIRVGLGSNRCCELASPNAAGRENDPATRWRKSAGVVEKNLEHPTHDTLVKRKFAEVGFEFKVEGRSGRSDRSCRRRDGLHQESRHRLRTRMQVNFRCLQFSEFDQRGHHRELLAPRGEEVLDEVPLLRAQFSNETLFEEFREAANVVQRRLE